MTGRSWEITVIPGGRVFSANTDHQAHPYEVARHRKAVREQAGWLAKAQAIPPLGRARVGITVHLRNWRRADPANWPGGSTVKAALDGLVDAGVVPDDTAAYLDVAMPVLAPLGDDRRPRVVLTVTEVAS